MYTKAAFLILLGQFARAMSLPSTLSVRETQRTFSGVTCRPSTSGLKSDIQYIQSDVEDNFHDPSGLFAPGGRFLVQDIIGSQTLCVGIGGSSTDGFATKEDIIAAIQQIVNACCTSGDTCEGGVDMTTSTGVNNYNVDIGPTGNACAAL